MVLLVLKPSLVSFGQKEIQKPQFQAGKEKPKLAIETQQEIIEFLLVNRASSLKSTISNLDKQIEELENSSMLPYSS